MARDTAPAHDATEGASHRAGALDIRNFIGGLIGLYGIVLTALGLFATSDADMDRTGGFAVNLWAGLGMLVAAAGFITWARLRPVVVPDDGGPCRRRGGPAAKSTSPRGARPSRSTGPGTRRPAR